MIVRFQMFCLTWLQYFFDNDTWQADILLYSASVTEALSSPFWFSNFMTLWKWRDQYLNMPYQKEAKKTPENPQNTSLLYFRPGNPFWNGAHMLTKNLYTCDVEIVSSLLFLMKQKNNGIRLFLHASQDRPKMGFGFQLILYRYPWAKNIIHHSDNELIQ